MVDLGSALDTLIAVVIVLLLLSLIVQSIQAGIKKLFKIKSKQIEDSLVYLIENALGESRAAQPEPLTSLPAQPAPSLAERVTGWLGLTSLLGKGHVIASPPAASVVPPGAKKVRWYNRSPMLRTILMLPDTPRDKAQPDVKALHDAVLQRFVAVGRISQYGASALESLSKEDLSKVMASVGIKEFLGEAADDIKAACTLVADARQLIDQIDKVATSGDVQLKWAAFRDAVAPLLNDVGQLFDSDKKDFKVTLLVSHVLELRKIELSKLLELAAAVREAVQTSPPSALVTDLDKVIEKLRTVPALIDEALAPVKARITAVETWYDTVMQSFEERYARSMRTVSFVIGLIVAVTLNADFFGIYGRLKNDDIARQRVMATQQAVVDLYSKETEGEVDRTQRSYDAETDAAKKKELATKLEKLKKDALGTWSADLQRDLEGKTDQYAKFGFKPITWEEMQTWKSSQWLTSIFGWIVMALLLTLGAPFWHDALQSLFGVKNLLQKKSETKNSEQKSGQGGAQPG